MPRKNFIVLLALSEDNAAAGKAMMDRLASVDSTCKPAWMDSRGAGVFVSTTIDAESLKEVALPESLPQWEQQSFRDMVILEIGPDCWCRSESKVDAWLGSHRTPSGAPDPTV